MAATKNSEIEAVTAVFNALKDLETETRQRVLASVGALLGLDRTATPNLASSEAPRAPVTVAAATDRPLSIRELIDQKHPGTNPQYVALFAYFREKYEGHSRFSRLDLKGYFAKARLSPPGNYDRDFSEAVKKGWIHEDGAESYLTSKGLEVVESGFPGERKHAAAASVRKVTKARGSRKRPKSS